MILANCALTDTLCCAANLLMLQRSVFCRLHKNQKCAFSQLISTWHREHLLAFRFSSILDHNLLSTRFFGLRSLLAFDGPCGIIHPEACRLANGEKIP